MEKLFLSQLLLETQMSKSCMYIHLEYIIHHEISTEKEGLLITCHMMEVLTLSSLSQKVWMSMPATLGTSLSGADRPLNSSQQLSWT